MESSDLKIKRENGTFDLINFSFRFNNIDPESAHEIKFFLDNAGKNVSINKQINKNLYVLVFETIDDSFDYKLILQIIEKYELNEINYGFWVAITSEYGHGGAYLTENIRRLYKLIGGQLDFSYLIGES